MTKTELLKVLEKVEDGKRTSPLLVFKGSELGAYLFKRGLSVEESLKLVEEEKREDEPGLDIGEAIELLLNDPTEFSIGYRVEYTTQELSFFVEDDGCPFQLCSPLLAKYVPDGGISSEGPVFGTIPIGTPVLIGEDNKEGYISIPLEGIKYSAAIEIESSFKTEDLLEKLKNTTVDLLYCSLSSPEGELGTTFSCLGGGNLSIGGDSSKEIAIVLLSLEKDLTKPVKVFIEEEISDYLSLEEYQLEVSIETLNEESYLIQGEEDGMQIVEKWEEGCMTLPKGTPYIYISTVDEDFYEYEEDEEDEEYEEEVNMYETYLEKGVFLNSIGLFKDAITSFNKAIKLKPNCSEAFHNKGVALGELGMYEEATEAFDIATFNCNRELRELRSR